MLFTDREIQIGYKCDLDRFTNRDDCHKCEYHQSITDRHPTLVTLTELNTEVIASSTKTWAVNFRTLLSTNSLPAATAGQTTKPRRFPPTTSINDIVFATP